MASPFPRRRAKNLASSHYGASIYQARGPAYPPNGLFLTFRAGARLLPCGPRATVVDPPHTLQERPHDQGVDLRPGAHLDLRYGGLSGDPVPVGSVGGHRVQGVGRGDHAHRGWNLLAAQPVRVAPAVQTLVMVPRRTG